MEAVFSDEFKKQMSKIKDKGTLRKLQKAVESSLANPLKGKYMGRNWLERKALE